MRDFSSFRRMLDDSRTWVELVVFSGVSIEVLEFRNVYVKTFFEPIAPTYVIAFMQQNFGPKM